MQAESTDEDSLLRFVKAQEGVFERALEELRQGKKRTHWMWFIFPQMRGLGHSAMAQHYGVASRKEAIRFLDHPILGDRLRLAVTTLETSDARAAVDVFGSVDAVKLRSCLTLFAQIDDGGVFAAALDRWFDGQTDLATLKLIEQG